MIGTRYQVIYHPLAEKEYLESVLWYEENRTGLGLQFIGEIERTLNNIENNPFLYSAKRQSLREAVVRIFPYVIVYKVNLRQKQVTILSVFHTRRNPAQKYKRK